MAQRIFTQRQGNLEGGLRSQMQTDHVERLVLESCHSTWVFDPERRRFRRILKGGEVEERPVTTPWRTYYGLEYEGGLRGLHRDAECGRHATHSVMAPHA